MKPLLIGEAPAPSAKKGDPAFSSRSGDRLTKLLGCSLFDVFETVNLLQEYPGSDEKGSRFPFGVAKEAATKLLVEVDRDRHLILAGKRVAAAFGMENAKYFHTVTLKPVPIQITVIPHPSGVNFWWNKPENVEFAKGWLKALRFAQRELDGR